MVEPRRDGNGHAQSHADHVRHSHAPDRDPRTARTGAITSGIGVLDIHPTLATLSLGLSRIKTYFLVGQSGTPFYDIVAIPLFLLPVRSIRRCSISGDEILMELTQNAQDSGSICLSLGSNYTFLAHQTIASVAMGCARSAVLVPQTS